MFGGIIYGGAVFGGVPTWQLPPTTPDIFIEIGFRPTRIANGETLCGLAATRTQAVCETQTIVTVDN